MIVAPSVLSADFGNLNKDLEMLNKSEAEWLHIDIMDGVFVPNISFGFPVLKTIREKSTQFLDVHLMIVQPEKYISEFIQNGAQMLTIHFETCTHLHRTIFQIKNDGAKAGIALNPHTSVDLLEDIISDLDLVLIMSVNPGFGGQKFIENTYSKVEKLKNLILKKNSKALIEIDGGVSLQNALLLKNAGADVLVAGNAVFSSENPSEYIKLMANV